MVSLNEWQSVTVAYLGDAVWELYVREYFIERGYKLHKTNLEVKKCVNAKFQSELYEKVFETLTEEEKIFAKRIKNSNINTFPKSCTHEEYRNATAFEGIIALWYKNQEYGKIKELVNNL